MAKSTTFYSILNAKDLDYQNSDKLTIDGSNGTITGQGFQINKNGITIKGDSLVPSIFREAYAGRTEVYLNPILINGDPEYSRTTHSESVIRQALSFEAREKAMRIAYLLDITESLFNSKNLSDE